MMVVSNVLHDDSCIYNTKTTSTGQNATGPLIYNDPKSEPYSDVLQSQSWIYMGTGQQTNISPFVVLTIIGYQILIHTHIPDAPWSTYRIIEYLQSLGIQTLSFRRYFTLQIILNYIPVTLPFRRYLESIGS